MKRINHCLLLSAAVAALLGTVACGGPSATSTHAPQPTIGVAPAGGPAPTESPAAEADTVSSEAASRATFAPCATAPAEACATGAVCVDGPRDRTQTCAPVVPQAALDEEANWDHLVIVEAPRIELYDRKQRCKSLPCGFPGAMLPLDTKSFIPMESSRGDVFAANGGIKCSSRHNMSDWGCPEGHPARLLGTVHAHRVSGQTPVLLTFEVVALEPAQ